MIFFNRIILLIILSYCNAIEIVNDISNNPSTNTDAGIDIDIYSDTEIERINKKINEDNIKVSENRLAIQLYAVIEHYKQEDPIGFPGASIPDPMDVPNMQKVLPFATLNMLNVKVSGLSKFRLAHIKADLKAMKINADIELSEMVSQGNYTLSSFFSNARGPFTVILKKVLVKGMATLIVQGDGQLRSELIKMDLTFGDMTMNFQNLGFLGQIFQNMINSAPNLVFDAMKPFMMQQADKQLRTEINNNIEKMMGSRLLPNSITPLDMAIAEGRKALRPYDPYRLPDYNRTVGIFTMQLSNTWLSGLSSFYRVGDVLAYMDNNTITLEIQVGTQQLSGASQWEIGCGLITRIGHIHFTVQHLRLSLSVSQALDTRRKPILNDIQIDLGNIQVRCDGAGTLDYILEFGVNVLPNLLRYQIMDALENPLKQRIQEKFNTINVEQEIKENFIKLLAANSNNNSISFEYMFNELSNKLNLISHF